MRQVNQLDWNPGGWFGSQLGGTAWILIAAAISIFHDASTGLVLLLLFVIPNAVGLLLWRLRKWSSYASIQILFASCGGCGLLAIYVLDRNDLWMTIQQGGAISEAAGYLLLSATVIVVMASLHLRFGRRPDDSPG